MQPSDPKFTAARAFIRSLNILLKFSRLYSFDHARTAQQFETAWNELHAAIPVTNESGLLLSASGSQLLLDGAPIDATPAERSFAQLLTAAGLASIQFTSSVKKEELERLVRAFPSQNTKPSVLAEKLKEALTGLTGIRINEVRFVAEDSSMTESRVAGLLTAQTLGADAGALNDWLRDPQKLLQLIAASEGTRSGPGAGPGQGPGGGGTGGASEGGTLGRGVSGTGHGSGGGSGTGHATEVTGSGSSGMAGIDNSLSGYYSGAPLTDELSQDGSVHGGSTPGSSTSGGGGVGIGGGGTGTSVWSAKDEDVLGILKLLTHLGHTVSGDGVSLQPGPLQEELTKLPPQSQEMLREALAAVAAQAPSTNSKDPMLLRLAEHLAIRFALERYQRGEVKVNAVRNMIDRMSQEIEGLRKILGAHEEKLAGAGIIVESNADLLDRQFWAAVPENGKRSVLCSSDAWCIPARNIRQYVEELIRSGNEKLALEILRNYASCVQSDEVEARRRTAIGLADIADLYGMAGGQTLTPAIQTTGAQLSLERDDNLQGLISAAFVRLAQEAGAKRLFPGTLQALDSLDSLETQRLVLAQTLRPRIGVEKRVPEYLEDALRADRIPDGLNEVLQRVPRATAENLVLRFNRTWNRAEMERLVELAKMVGGDFAASMRDTLRTGPANEAAETVGLLSHLDPLAVERWLPDRLPQWPRNAQDRMVRLLAMSGSTERGKLLVNLVHTLDPVLLALAIDEIGLSDDPNCMQSMIHLAEDGTSRTGNAFVRLKALEALGRLKAQPAVELLRSIVEARHMFHWTNHFELRLAAIQSLTKIDPQAAKDFVSRSGFTASDLALAPLDPPPTSKYFRRRRYTRVRLAHPLPATVTAGQDSYRLEIRGLSLSGGIAVGEKHLQPGTLISMKIGSPLRPIRAQVLMRDVRAQGLGFEFADMDLDERTRLRKLLLDNISSMAPKDQGVLVPTGA